MTLRIPDGQTFLTALVGVAPTPARHVSADLALQRLRYVPGRTLTETAMQTEQAWIEARLGVAGRRLSAGIVDGLAIGLEDQTARRGAFHLGAGRAIAPGGQDVAVLKPASFMLDDLPELGTAGDASGAPRGLIALALEPVVVEIERLPQDGSRLFAFEDPCPPDAAATPYLDFVLQDAARLGWTRLDPALAGTVAARAANVAAEAIRRIEDTDPAALPWAAFGAPVCLMFVAPDGRIQWTSRSAVARRGAMAPAATDDARARIAQSRLEGLIEDTGAATARLGWDGTDARAFMRWMPPAGVLPRKAWAQPGFFPPSWAVAQAPIPISQLDAALEASRRLAPLDLDAPRDRVKFLVPVPDALYAPDLLEPVTTPDFDAVRIPLRARIGDARALREAYRAQARAVQGVIDAAAISDFAIADEDPVPGEDAFPAAQPAPTLFDAEARAALGAAHAGLTPALFTADQLAMVDPARLDGVLDAAAPFGATPFVTTMRALTDAANDTVDFAFNRVQAEIYRLRQIMLDNEEATKLATFPVLAGLAKGSNSFAMAEGLRAHFAAGKSAAPAAAPAGVPMMARMMVLPMSGPRGSAFSGDVAGDVAGGADLALAVPEGGLKGSTMISSFGEGAASLFFGSVIADASAASGANATLVKDLVDNTRAGLIDDAILSDAKSKRSGILRAAPLPGDIRDVRSATIADRLKASASVDAKASAVRIKADVLRQMQGLGLSLVGLTAPLTSSRDRVLLPRADIDAAIADTLTAEEQEEFKSEITKLRRPLSDAGAEDWDLMALTPPAAEGGATIRIAPMTRLGAALLRRTAPISMTLLPALAMTKELDPDPADGADDESAYLSAAVSTLEGVIAILRRVEGRILAITGQVDALAAALPGLTDIQTRWDGALALADQDLDEARHDLRVAISLIDEETRRLAALAAHRAKVLAKSVTFVAYARPRALTAHRAGDTLGLMLPGAMEDPLPASLRRDVDLPEGLAAMIGALREMPIGWLASNPELAAEFASPPYLSGLLAGLSARAKAARGRAAAPAPDAKGGPAARQIGRVSGAYRALSLQMLDARATVDIRQVEAASWSERRRRALELLSLNDLIEGASQPAVARRAATEIEHIERVAHALWQLARQAPAPVRLLWAQALSEYDAVASLANLTRLPGWDHVDFAPRKKMERLNAWLFARMEKGVAEAEALMTDLVRVALLLSAHAPVADIIAARIEKDQSAKPGGAIDIVIRRGRPKIGMQVSILDANLVQASGVIRDLHGANARVEIMHTVQPLVSITQSQTVTLFAPGALTRTGA